MVMIGPMPEGKVIAVLSPPSGRIVILDEKTEQVIIDTAVGGMGVSITRWGCVVPGALIADVYAVGGHVRYWIKSVRIA